MFKFFDCYQIPQLNCKFKRLVVSPQRMIVAGENHANNFKEKFFYTNKCMLLNIGIELPICEGNGYDFPCSVSKLSMGA